MNLWILDTDCLSLFHNGNLAIRNRVLRTPPQQIATTIITAEEQIRGRLNLVRRAETGRNLSNAYRHFQEAFVFFQGVQVLEFSLEAETIYWQLKAQKIRPGSQDLKIASIALSLDATVITRNRKDFQQVPNLKFEDWSI